MEGLLDGNMIIKESFHHVNQGSDGGKLTQVVSEIEIMAGRQANSQQAVA